MPPDERRLTRLVEEMREVLSEPSEPDVGKESLDQAIARVLQAQRQQMSERFWLWVQRLGWLAAIVAVGVSIYVAVRGCQC